MAPKARLYKYVTPPAIKGGATIKIGGKTVAGPSAGFTQLIKATNSIGATVNSIAIIVEDLNKTFASNMKMQMKQTEEMFKLREKQFDKIQSDKKKQEEKQKKAEGLKQDEKAEATQEKKKSIIGSVAGTVGKAAAFGLGFLKGIFDLFGSVFKAVIMYNLLDWISKPENLKKVESMIKTIKSIAQFIFKFVETFVNMGLGGLADFLENPLSLKGLFGILKFVVALGLLFNPLGMAKLGIQLAVKLFRGGKLIKLLTGLFKGIGGMIRGLMSFVKARGLGGLLLGGALLFGVGAAAEMIPGAIGTETDKLIDEDERSEEEKIKTLEEQLKSLSFWDKLWGKDAEIKEQIERIKTGEDPSYGLTGMNPSDNEKPVPEGYFRASNGEILKEPNLFASGGEVAITPFVPKFGGKDGFAKGGWITGPQSGYPVSLDGGKSTAFIGHGTEWVGYPKAASGGAFVVPFDTPATRANKGLTGMRMRQAMSGGYALPGFATGGQVPVMPALPEFSSGGVFNPVLDLIAKYEAGPGGWESMYPSTRLKGATKMTISEVAKRATGAVGMYQNLPRYLVARAKAVGLNPNKDLYNEANQRKIAEYLIGRGQAGVTADMMRNKPDEAMLRLSRVWAAIPVPYDTQGHRKRVKKGESYYAGVGSNKAHITPEMMYKAMGQVTGKPIDPNITGGPSTDSNDVTPDTGTGSGGPSENATTEQKDPFQAAQENLLNILNKWLPHTQDVPGPGSSNTSGDMLNKAELDEQEEKENGKTNVSVSTAKLPDAGATADPNGTKAPDPVMLPNTYVIPANDFVKPRFGLMADVSTEPVSLY